MSDTSTKMGKNLTHQSLIELVRAFAPTIPEEGVCNGFTSMWIQAVATGEEQELNFYNRLDALSAYLSNSSHTIETLKNEIKAVQDSQKSPTRKPLTESELDLIDIQAFAESIAIQQDPIRLNLFKEFISPVVHKATLYPFTASATLEKNSPALKIKSDLIGVVAATHRELEQYFNNILDVLRKENYSKTAGNKNKKISFLLCSDNHAIGVYLNPQSEKWHFLDINSLSNKENFYFRVDSSQLATLVFLSLFDEKNPTTLFSITCISTQHDQALVAPLKTITHKLLPNSSTKVNSRGFNALPLAAIYGDTSSIKALITAGANVEAANKRGRTALMLAAENGHTSSVLALITAGANVEAIDKDGFTALMLAAYNGHTSSVLALITAGANIEAANKGGGTALMLAAYNGHTSSVLALITAGANVEAANKGGGTALMLAAQNGHLSAVKFLVDAKKERHQGFGSLLFSVQNIADSISARYWRKIDVVDKEGKTALMLAANNGHLEVVQFLITRQANLRLQNQQGHTALMLAAQQGQIEAVKFLVSQQADMTVKNNQGNTALMLAAQNHRVSVVKFLISQKADINVQNDQGNSALMLAVEEGHYHSVSALLQHGASLNLTNKFQLTALTLAKKNSDRVIADLLIHAGAVEYKSWGAWLKDSLFSLRAESCAVSEPPRKRARI